MTDQARQPAGIPAGGQFAAHTHAESSTALLSAPHLRVPADVDPITRVVTDQLASTGLGGDVTITPGDERRATELEITTGDGANLRVLFHGRENPHGQGRPEITSFCAYYQTGDADEVDLSGEAAVFGGAIFPHEMRRAIRHAIHSALAREEWRHRGFADNVDEFEMNEFAPEPEVPPFRRWDDPDYPTHPAMGATVGPHYAHTVLQAIDGETIIEMDGLQLRPDRQSTVHAVVCADIVARLRVAGSDDQTASQRLAAIMVDVEDAVHSSDRWRAIFPGQDR